MTDDFTPLPDAPPHWLELTPEELIELHRQMVRSQAEQMTALAEVGAAAMACRQFPECETAADACRLATLLAVVDFSA